MSSQDNVTPRELKPIAKWYSNSLDTHGVGAKSVGWNNEASHRLRFEKLVQVIDKSVARQGITVNDLGCGYGAIFPYLDSLKGVKLNRYSGYEISDEMIAAAKEYLDDSRAEIIKSFILKRKADYSFASGIFNVRFKESEGDWTEYIKDIIKNLAEMSNRGFAFNILTTYVDWKEKHLYYADPLFYFDFCKREISRFVVLLHDYPLYEWTMLVKMEG